MTLRDDCAVSACNLLPRSVCKCSHPLLVGGRGKSAFGQMSTTLSPQLRASETKQTFPSTNLACLLAFEQQTARPHHTYLSSSNTNILLQQHKRRLYTWTSLDGQCWNQIYILCSQRWRSSVQSAKTRPGAEYGSDHELLIAKFRLKLKKVGKTTRPFRYDLNHIPYNYTVEVTNRFKGLDLIECLKNYGWRFITLYRKWLSKHPQEEEMQKGKMVVWGGLTNSWEKKRSKR